jgi:hypothetical protein
MKHFFLNFGEHLLLKHLLEALDRRLPALPRPLVLGLLAVDRADRRQRLGAGVILGDRGLLGQPIDPVAAFLSGYLERECISACAASMPRAWPSRSSWPSSAWRAR